ncbi:MAG: mechanosensitive ion channel [Rhodocyclaceae bacterium]|nr:mechanosensitive ion channel [Rhodocyclaceae bacterium]
MDTFFLWLPNNLERPVRILFILILAGLALRAVRRLIPRLQEAITARQGNVENSRRIHTLSTVIRYVLTIILAVVTGLLVLSELGVSVAPILGAAGLVGIAVSLGVQSLVKDYLSGIFLLLENQIRLGDIVEVGGKTGCVEEMTLRYLRLRDDTGVIHFVPNGSVSVVTNKSLP